MDGIIDTSIVIDIYRGYEPALEWRKLNAERKYAITPIVWMEAVEGARNKNDQRKMLRLLSLFQME